MIITCDHQSYLTYLLTIVLLVVGVSRSNSASTAACHGLDEWQSRAHRCDALSCSCWTVVKVWRDAR